jgi:hypothetical protein
MAQGPDARGPEFYCLEKNKKGKGLLPTEAGNCLLAHAWAKPFKKISVDGSSFAYIQRDKTISDTPHQFSDVVDWFDEFDTPFQASQVISELLDGVIKEYTHPY